MSGASSHQPPVMLMLGALLILVGCIPLMAALALYTLFSQSSLKEAEVNADKLAALLLKSFEQTMEPMDSAMLTFSKTFDPAWTPFQTYEALTAFSLPASFVQISVVDKNGIFVTSNLAPPNAQKIDLSDREHIRVHMDRNAGNGKLFVSKPVLGRVSKTWTIQLSRPLDDGQGHFAGVVVASYSISDFINFYNQLRTDDSMVITLIGTDGIVRARAATTTSFGDDLSRGQAFKAALKTPNTPFVAMSPLDGIERVGFIRTSQHYPIMVAVGYSIDYISDKTRDFRLAIGGTAAGLSAALLLVVLLGQSYVRMQKRLEAGDLQAVARQREANVLDAISRVPGISVMHVTAEGPSEIGVPPPGPFSALVRTHLESQDFRASAQALTGPSVSKVHLSDGQTDMEVELVVAPLRTIATATPDRQDVVVFTLDLTRRRMEENQLYQMSKLASLGELATGLAHEINQPLGVIRLAAANALAGMKQGFSPEYMQSKLERILQQTVRMSQIIDHMRIFGRKSDGELLPSCPREAIEGALQVMGAQLRLDNTQVTVDCPVGPPRVLCRQEQLEQVLINLLQNARDAVRDRRAATGRQFVGNIAIAVKADPASAGAGPMVRLDISDNAGGIPAGIIERVFQPFFTTKPPGMGTGLGLSVSFGIVRDHGGILTAANGPDGAVFTIRLPSAPRPASTTELPAAVSS